MAQRRHLAAADHRAGRRQRDLYHLAPRKPARLALPRAQDPAGNLVRTITYVKVPVGKVSVTFTNNLVSSLEQSEGTLDRDARTSIVTAPFFVSY